MTDIVALLIPILFVVGLFTTISLNIFYKNRTRETLSKNLSAADLGEWMRVEQSLAAQRNRNSLLRTVGFLVGAGVGILLSFAVITHPDFAAASRFDRHVLGTFTVIASAIACGGVGMIGSYFVQKLVERKN